MTEILTGPEVGERLRCSPQAVRKLVRQGMIGHLRIGKLIRIPASAVEEYLCANLQSPSPKSPPTKASGTSASTSAESAEGTPYIPRIGPKPKPALVTG